MNSNTGCRGSSALARGWGGAKCGGGGPATSTSVAFIHLAAPIRAPVTHPQPHRCLPRGLRVFRPCSQLGAGCSGTPLRWHPGRRSPSIQPLELGGRDRRSERPRVRPIPDRRQRGMLRRPAAHTEGKASRADGDEGRPPGAGARGWQGRGR